MNSRAHIIVEIGLRQQVRHMDTRGEKKAAYRKVLQAGKGQEYMGKACCFMAGIRV